MGGGSIAAGGGGGGSSIEMHVMSCGCFWWSSLGYPVIAIATSPGPTATALPISHPTLQTTPPRYGEGTIQGALAPEEAGRREVYETHHWGSKVLKLSPARATADADYRQVPMPPMPGAKLDTPPAPLQVRSRDKEKVGSGTLAQMRRY